MTKNTWKAISIAAQALYNTGARSATAYLEPGFVVRVSCMHRPDRRNRATTYSVTFGAPNYAAREFVKRAKRAGEPFPVRKVQLTSWPRKRK